VSQLTRRKFVPKKENYLFDAASLDSQAFSGIDLKDSMILSPNSLLLYGPYQKEFDYMLFEGERVTLLSQQDAEKLAENPNLYSLNPEPSSINLIVK
jgi:hypothetical protein